MSTLWQKLLNTESSRYDVRKLVNAKFYEPFATTPAQLHLICDIDKTYLETEFDTVLEIARVAFEDAAAKLTVPGADQLLQHFRWGPLLGEQPPGQMVDALAYPRPLHFVSSSPPQLRAVIEEKLTLDQVDWTSITLKDQAYNIRKRRLDQLRQHAAYKSLAILRILAEIEPGSRVVCIGDNAELDPLIYLAVRHRLDGSLSLDGFCQVLMLAGVDSHVAESVANETREVPNCTVSTIYIRRVIAETGLLTGPLARGFRLFHGYLEVALSFLARGYISPDAAPSLLRRLHNVATFNRHAISTTMADVLERDGVAPGVGAKLAAAMLEIGCQPPEGLAHAEGRESPTPTPASEADLLRAIRIATHGGGGT